MVYSNKFVMCILYKGTPQKELRNGVVKLPFGAEYVLRLRNKNTRRALVKIFIDGENVSGGGYIIDGNDSIDIKRHHDKDRAFKFVPLDSGEAVEFGKDGPNEDKQKGTIEARFYFEKARPAYTPVPFYVLPQPLVKEEHHHHHHYPNRSPFWYGTVTCDSYQNDSSPTYGCSNDATYSCDHMPLTGGGPSGQHTNSVNLSSMNTTRGMHRSKSMPTEGEQKTSGGIDLPPTIFPCLQDAAPAVNLVSHNTPLKDGCTVEGEVTGQKFHSVYFEAEETYTAITIFLQGFGEYESEYEEDKPAVAASTRKTNKNKRLDDLESENEKLRLQLAELENQKLKAELEGKKPPKKRTRKVPKK